MEAKRREKEDNAEVYTAWKRAEQQQLEEAKEDAKAEEDRKKALAARWTPPVDEENQLATKVNEGQGIRRSESLTLPQEADHAGSL